MNPFFYSEEAGAKGPPPLSPAPQIPAQPKPSLRLRLTFAPERRSASLRNRCSFTGMPSRLAGSSHSTSLTFILGANWQFHEC